MFPGKKEKVAKTAEALVEPVADALQKTEVLREQIAEFLFNEATVINHRMSWFTSIEGLIFVGFGMLYKHPATDSVYRVLEVFGILGIAIAVITFLSLLASSHAQRRLVEMWDQNKPANYWGPGVIALNLALRAKWMHYFSVWNFLPIVIAVGWIAVLLIPK